MVFKKHEEKYPHIQNVFTIGQLTPAGNKDKVLVVVDGGEFNGWVLWVVEEKFIHELFMYYHELWGQMPMYKVFDFTWRREWTTEIEKI